MRVPRELLPGDLRARWLEYVLAGCLIGAVAGIVVVQRAIADSAESEVHDLAHRIGKNMLVVPARGAAQRHSNLHHAARRGRESRDLHPAAFSKVSRSRQRGTW